MRLARLSWLSAEYGRNLTSDQPTVPIQGAADRSEEAIAQAQLATHRERSHFEQLYSEEVAKRIEWLERQIQRIDMFADSVHLMNQQAQMATAEVRTLKKELMYECEQARLSASHDAREKALRDKLELEKSEQ